MVNIKSTEQEKNSILMRTMEIAATLNESDQKELLEFAKWIKSEGDTAREANREEAERVAAAIRGSDQWDDGLNRQLCYLAGLLDQYANADSDTFEEVVFRAADILGVEVV